MRRTDLIKPALIDDDDGEFHSIDANMSFEDIVGDFSLPKTFESNDVVKRVYELLMEDRKRAVLNFQNIQNIVRTSDKKGAAMFTALTEAQKAIQTSSDKLVQLAKIVAENAPVKNTSTDFSSIGLDIFDEDTPANSVMDKIKKNQE